VIDVGVDLAASDVTVVERTIHGASG